MKMTSWSLNKALELIAINGPTYNADIAPFSWINFSFKYSTNHIFMPETFKFSPYLVGWNLENNSRKRPSLNNGATTPKKNM